MNENVRKNLAAGINRVKWMAGYVAERTKAETSAAKLFYESSKLEGRLDEIYRDIGKRVAELKESTEGDDLNVLEDSEVRSALNEIKRIHESVNEYKKQAKDITKFTE